MKIIYKYVFITVILLLANHINCDTKCLSCADIGYQCNINTDDIILKCIYDSPCVGGYCYNRDSNSVGTGCSYDSYCKQGLACLDEECQNIYFQQANDICLNSSQCVTGMPCNSSYRCFQAENSCTSDIQCPANQYCGMYASCEDVLPIYGTCYQQNQCGISNICYQNRCYPKYSIQEGEDCDVPEPQRLQICDISQNLTCQIGSSGSYQCVTYQRTLGTCGEGEDTECLDDYEYCDCDTSTCKSIYSFQSICKIAYETRDACLANNNCQYFGDDYVSTFDNKTCGLQYCSQQICDTFHYCYDSEYPCAPIPQYCTMYSHYPKISLPLSSEYFIHKGKTQWPIYSSVIIAVVASVLLMIVSIVVFRKLKSRKSGGIYGKSKKIKMSKRNSDNNHSNQEEKFGNHNQTIELSSQPPPQQQYVQPQFAQPLNPYGPPPPTPYGPPPNYESHLPYTPNPIDNNQNYI